MMEAAVEIEHLVKTFPAPFGGRAVRAVDDVSIRIESGEVYGLIGPNGSGKSTTMKALLGLVAPSAGRCRIFGADSLAVDSREKVGFLPENPYFYKHLSGVETIRFYGKLCGLRGARLERRIDELLTLVDLQDARQRRLGTYSKGMLQRIGLAQALVQEPELVILDEPTAGVDPIGSRQIRDLILALRERGITVFLCSHLLEQVQEVCDRVGIIFHGRMIREGRLDELLAIDDQTELILRDAPDELLAIDDQTELILRDAPAELLAEIRARVEATAGTSLVRCQRPRTTLERLFLSATRDRSE